MVLCLGITTLVCLSVTLFSFQSKVRSKQQNRQICEVKQKFIITFYFPQLFQIDVTSCQGVLFSLCMVMLLCAITLSIVVPFGYVSSRTPLWKQSKIAVSDDE